ncbi:hypothetical protein CEP54_005109 [Fusarium duplospermum]|uniref:Uncharacterized protein n=1 Tax=Fusarium duplospermum TaxID=1325734 RepID=A0A428QEE8_9HYPO|nr:hypothetical protein CEP54_005109 [Fusarium duplospermum]
MPRVQAVDLAAHMELRSWQRRFTIHLLQPTTQPRHIRALHTHLMRQPTMLQHHQAPIPRSNSSNLSTKATTPMAKHPPLLPALPLPHLRAS